MDKNKIKVIACICLLVFMVGIFVACKKGENDETTQGEASGDGYVKVDTDEDGSLYYTDPTFVIDDIVYGGETHYVKPDETNSAGEYKIGDVTSQPYVTDDSGKAVPVTEEPATTGNTNTDKPGKEESTTAGNQDPTNTTEKQSEQQTKETETSSIEYESIGVVDDNKLSNDGVIDAW